MSIKCKKSVRKNIRDVMCKENSMAYYKGKKSIKIQKETQISSAFIHISISDKFQNRKYIWTYLHYHPAIQVPCTTRYPVSSFCLQWFNFSCQVLDGNGGTTLENFTIYRHRLITIPSPITILQCSNVLYKSKKLIAE